MASLPVSGVFSPKLFLLTEFNGYLDGKKQNVKDENRKLVGLAAGYFYHVNTRPYKAVAGKGRVYRKMHVLIWQLHNSVNL